MCLRWADNECSAVTICHTLDACLFASRHDLKAIRLLADAEVRPMHGLRSAVSVTQANHWCYMAVDRVLA